MAEDILGISGQMDISDIQKSLDKLCDGLNRVGVDTDELSQRMTKSLNDIAKSDGDMSVKIQQAMQVLKSAMSEATNGLKVVPDMIDNANKRVETIQGTISTLNAKLNETDKTSDAFNSITKQIDVQSRALQIAKDDAKELSESYNYVRNSIAEVNGAYQTLSAFSSASMLSNNTEAISNTAVSTSSVAASTGLIAESAAHAANAASALNNASATEQSAQATQHLSTAIQEYISTSEGRENIDRMQSENSKDLKAEIKVYEDAIKEIQGILDNTDFGKKIENANKSIEKQTASIAYYKEELNKSTPEQTKDFVGERYNIAIDKAQQKIADLQNQIVEWEREQQRLNSDLEQYNILLESAKQVQSGKTLVSDNDKAVANIDTTSASEYTQRLNDAKTKLQELEAEANKFSGQKLTDKQKEELENLNYEIAKTKEEISSLKAAIREKNEETFIGKLRNKLSDAGTKISDFGQSLKEKIQKPFEELSAKFNDSSFIKRFKAELEQAKLGLNSFKDGVVNVMTSNGKFQQQIGVIGEAFKGLGIPIDGSLTAIKSVTKALWAMCATPVGAVIAAIALAFKAVHTWMTKSSEGQLVYTKLMAYFGSLAKSVTDIVVILGSYLYHCFTDANAPLKNFGNNFVKTFKTAVTAAVNLISGLGTTIKGVFNLDWDTFASGLKQTWDGIKGAGSTIISGFKTALTGAVGTIKTIYDGFTDDKLGKDLSSVFNSAFSTASKAASLAGQIQQTQIDIKKNTIEQAKLNEQIAEQKNKIYTLQGKEKIAALETTKELIKQKYDKQIQQQQRLVELSEKNAKLHTQSLESIAAERELRKDVLNTQTQLNADQRMLIRQEESAKKKIDSSENTAAKKEAKQDASITSAEGKLSEVEYKNDYARLQAMQDMEQKIVDAKIEALEEGEEKILAQRKRQLEKELEQIEKEKETAVKAERDRQKAEFDARQDVVKAKGGKVRNWNDKTDLDNSKVTDIVSQYDEYAKVRIQVSNQNEQKRIKEQQENERTSVQSYLKEYGTSEEKRTALKDEAEDKKKKLDENKTISDTDREYQKKSIDEGLKKSLKDLDFQDLKKSINWDFVFGDLEHVSKSTLGTVKEQLQSFMDSAKDLKPDEIKTLVDAMTQIQDKMDLSTPISSIKSARKEYKELSKEYKKYKQEYDDASASGDVDKQKTAAEKMVKTEQKMVKAQNKEKASYEEVMNVAKQYAQALNDVGETIGGTTGEYIKLAASAISCGLSMAEGIKKFGNAVSAMEKAVAILAIIEAALQAIQIVMNAFGGTDTTLTDYVDTMNVCINLLNDSISDLNESMSDTQNTMKETIAYYEDLVKLEKDSATAIKSQSQTWLNSGASWKSSSQGVKIRKQIEKDLKSSNAEVKQFYTEGYNALNEYYKKVNGTYAKSASDFGRMDFLWKLSDEDLVKLSEDTKALSLLGDTLSSAITEYAEKIKAISDDEDSLGESLLSVSFDDFYDDFTSLIKDMDNDSEDFANNFAEYMRNALVKNLVAEQYKGKLETLYKKATDWAKAGVLEDHIDELKKEYEEYADSAKKDVETIDKITGYEDSSEQSATSKAIEAITEDQASSLIGIGYAMQIALEQGNEVRASIGIDISSMRGYTELISNNITEMRDIQYEGLGQLQQIVKNTAPIILIREDISSMYKLMKDKY